MAELPPFDQRYWDAIERLRQRTSDFASAEADKANNWGILLFNKLFLLNGGGLLFVPTVLQVFGLKSFEISDLSVVFWGYGIGLFFALLVAGMGYLSFYSHSELMITNLGPEQDKIFKRYFLTEADFASVDPKTNNDKSALEQCIRLTYWVGVGSVVLSFIGFIVGSVWFASLVSKIKVVS